MYKIIMYVNPIMPARMKRKIQYKSEGLMQIEMTNKPIEIGSWKNKK